MEIKFFNCSNIDYSGTINDIDMIDELFATERTIKGENYSLNDCVMVRATNSFPFSKIISTPANGNDVILADSYILYRAIVDYLEELHPEYKPENNVVLRDEYGFKKKQFDSEMYKDNLNKLFNELAKYKVLCKNYRSTIHFTINGLVGSHAYGDFSNRNFIIIEPLKYHINTNSLLSLGVNDTYFNEDMKLSSEAAILMNEDVYREIYGSEEYMDTLRFVKVYIYKGNEKIAVSRTLNDLGYDSFLINSHGYVNGYGSNTAASHMEDFIRKLGKEIGKGYLGHFNSGLNNVDNKKTDEESVKTDWEHLKYILKRAIEDILIDKEDTIKVLNAASVDGLLNGEEKENIEKMIGISLDSQIKEIDFTDSRYRYNTYDSELLKIIPYIVRKIGLENIEKYTKEFNNNYLEELNNKRSSMHR